MDSCKLRSLISPGDPLNGGSALPPGFPVVTPLIFTSVLIFFTQNNFSTFWGLGNIVPGTSTIPLQIQNLGAPSFSNVRLIGSLNVTDVTVDFSDGKSEVIPDPNLMLEQAFTIQISPAIVPTPTVFFITANGSLFRMLLSLHPLC